MASKRLISRADRKIDREIATGSAAMGPVTFSPIDKEGNSVAVNVLECRLHLSAASATSENLVVSIDSQNGSEYDIVILTRDMDTVQDLRFCTDVILLDGDSLLFNWANSDSRTYGLEIIYEAYKS